MERIKRFFVGVIKVITCVTVIEAFIAATILLIKTVIELL